MNAFDALLNRFTMYRLVVYVLAILSGLSIVFAFMGRIPTSPTELVISAGILVGVAYVTDRVLGKFLNVPTNMESALITGLILFLILQPATNISTGLALALAAAAGIASKFLLAWQGKHIFNPAALGAAVVSLSGLAATTWWVGNSAFWPFTLVLGLVVVRKIRRVPLFVTFAVVTVLLQAVVFITGHQELALSLKQAIIASPLLFLGTIMLTEPATMPPRRREQMIFAAIVAILYVKAWTIGPLAIYPEVALLLGNIYAYAVSPKFRIRLRLTEKRRVSERVYDYVFEPDRPFIFRPGQYMEWTLPGVPYDARGNRRTFTIASSPTESVVHLGVKFNEPASAYKSVLHEIKPGDMMYASQLSGNFTLDGSANKKLLFIAGGIGITPFRSMIKYLTDKNMQTDAVLLYIVGDAQEFAYVRDLQAAASVGIKTVPVVTDLTYQAPGVVSAKVDSHVLQKLVPDIAERTCYVSGPPGMVDGYKHMLGGLGVSRTNIRTDHFSGY